MTEAHETVVPLQFVPAEVFTDGDAVRDGSAGVGVGVSVAHGELVLAIDDGEGVSLLVYLDAEQLDLFADALAEAIEQLNCAEAAALGPSQATH